MIKNCDDKRRYDRPVSIRNDQRSWGFIKSAKNKRGIKIRCRNTVIAYPYLFDNIGVRGAGFGSITESNIFAALLWQTTINITLTSFYFLLLIKAIYQSYSQF